MKETATYVRNLCALWESDPRLAMALESVHEDEVPPLEPAREGGWTVKISAASASSSVYLHSRYRPAAEARAWATVNKLSGGGKKSGSGRNEN